MLRRTAGKLALALVASAILWAPGEGLARKPLPPSEGPTVSMAELPAQARTTYDLILRGGPFPHAHKDGSVFGNRERQLPAQPRGYYREYTVKTPGSRSRGARRIVCGGRQPTQPDACFYTGDHYASFSRIVP